jgi:hypothetical protein
VMAVDMNKDGVVDVLTTGANGSFILFGNRGRDETGTSNGWTTVTAAAGCGQAIRM